MFYTGTATPKYTKEQTLKMGEQSMQSGHCSLCDDTVRDSATEHMRKHRKELTAWLARRRTKAQRASLAGLNKARKARATKEEDDV